MKEPAPSVKRRMTVKRRPPRPCCQGAGRPEIDAERLSADGVELVELAVYRLVDVHQHDGEGGQLAASLLAVR